jgi:hypothetical protein
MTRTNSAPLLRLLGLLLLVSSVGRIDAQEPQTAPSPVSPSALPASPTDAPVPVAVQAKVEQPMGDKDAKDAKDDNKEASSPKLPQSAGVASSAVKGKKGQQPYTGPTTVIVLPPTPMLDEEGKQMQDPDGKLMFNLPVSQQRDKKGHPLFDAKGKPVMQTKENLGYDENGKKLHAVKVKPPKTVSVSISRGILTVDGLTGKAALNYEIKDLKYLYFYVPGVGTTVVSNGQFPGAVEQKHSFDDKTLTVTVGEHVVQLSSDKRMLGKAPQSAFVRVDKNFVVPTKFPVMGYGPIRVAPYAWPGSRANEELKGAAEAPPLPADLRPTLLLQPCPAGQMRPASPAPLPGQTVAPKPCVPISTATNANNSAASSAGNMQPNR